MKKEQKWYNIEMLVDILVFILPPLGIYGIYKTDKIKSKTFKFLYSLFGVISFLIMLKYLFLFLVR